MFGLSQSELLCFLGIGMLLLALLIGIINIAVFRITGRKLKEKLEIEYGKPWK